MSPHVATKLLSARRALAELHGALMEVAPDGAARIAVARAADSAHEALAVACTAAGQHPLDPRRATLPAPPHDGTGAPVSVQQCDIAGCWGCPLCAVDRRGEVVR